MSWLTMKGQPWRSLEMDSISKNIMHGLKLGLIFVYYCIVLHGIVKFSCGEMVTRFVD